MALSIKVFGSGTIGSTQSNNDLLNAYTNSVVPTGKAGIVKSLRLVNRDTVKRTVTINYLPGGSNAAAVSPSGILIPPGGILLIDDEIMLMQADKLQASFGETGSSLVDFVVGGVERDQ